MLNIITYLIDFNPYQGIELAVLLLINDGWWNSIWFRSIFIPVIIGVGYLFFLLRLRNIRKQKKILEEKIYSRTEKLTTINLQLTEKQEEILQQSEEIMQQQHTLEERNNEIKNQNDKLLQQNKHILSQKEQLEKQKKVIETALENIKDSIVYAKRIQQSVLPPDYQIDMLLPEYFIYYNPCNVVSGDFYWVKQIRDKIILAAADCTGHGVPGAFMSLLGISALNEISHQSPYLIASEVLNVLRGYVITSLHLVGNQHDTKDGMDISLCIFDQKEKTFQFAGAYNPLLILRDKNTVLEDEKNIDRLVAHEFDKCRLLQIKADRMPIGVYSVMKSFKNITLKYDTNDTFYLFSDGFRDQPGGPGGRKYMSPNFRKFIVSLQDTPMKEQKAIFSHEFDNWKKGYPQVDDVLVMGVKFSEELH